MVRKVVRTRQPIETKRKLLSQFGKTPISKEALTAMDILERGIENVPREEKMAFLKRNSGVFARVAADFHGGDYRMFKKGIDVYVNRFPEKNLNLTVQDTIKAITDAERIRAADQLETQFKRYLKAREIPLDKDALELTFKRFFLGGQNLQGLRVVNMGSLEQMYLEMRKFYREEKFNQQRRANGIFPLVTSGLRLTGNQKKRIKRLIQQRLKILEEREKNLIRKARKDGTLSTDAFSDEYVKITQDFALEIREEVLQTFTTKSKSSTNRISAPTEARKSGTREERIAGYDPGEKNASERVKEIKQKKEMATSLGAPFNVTEYCLAEIFKLNQRTGQELRQLVKNGILNDACLVGLFTSGNLTQRIFLKTLNETNFLRDFGNRQVNVLARGLAFIGPTGKQIGRATRAFQSPQREEIFRFLERNGLLETQHGGGKVVYLARSA